MNSSKYISKIHLIGLRKMGDALLPGFEHLPSFSDSGALNNIDRILNNMPRVDRKDLTLLLLVMAILPMFAVRIFIYTLERFSGLPGPFGGLIRFVRIGIRGLVFTLYYSQPIVHKELGYEVSVYTEDLNKN